jgi:hypothetical protein
MDNFDLKKYLTEGRLLKEEVDVNKILSDGGYDEVDDEELLMTVKNHPEFNSNIDAEKLNLLVMKIEDEEGGNIDFSEGKLLKEDTGVDMILSPNQIKRYARMKTVGNISDPKLISKVIEIISDILPQNPNISKEELANQFGEDVVQKTTQILFSAYIDGYSDKAGNLPLVKDYISIFTQMADDERDEELAEGRVLK